MTNTEDLVTILNLSSTNLNNHFVPFTNCGLAILNLAVFPDSFDNTDYTRDIDANRIGG